MSESVKYNLVGNGTKTPFGGYVSAPDKTSLAHQFLAKGSKNVYIKKTGTVANRPGLKRRGAQISTLAGVLESFEWDTSLGATRPLKVADGALQVESDIVETGTYVWYDLLTGLTNTRLIFDTWWDDTAKKDLLLFCDGTDGMKKWSGGIALIASSTVNTIVFANNAATYGFSGSGTVIINGTEYTFSGVTTTTLTGVSPDPTGEAVGSVVLQKPDTDTDTVEDGYLIDFIKVVNNQLYTGSETSRKVYVSKNTDWTDFTKSSPRATGEGEEITLDENPTGIGQREGKAHIGSKKAWYEVSYNQLTVGSTLSEQTKVDRKAMSGKKGLLRHEFVGNVGDDMVYVTQDQQLHIYGSFRNFTQSQFPSLSDDIEVELKNEDLTGGHIKTVGGFIYITAPNNGRVWLHETVTRTDAYGDITYSRMWHAPFIWNLSRICVIDGEEYGYSNARPEIYQLWDTLQWSDDGQDDEYLPYDSVATFGYRSANRHDLLTMDKMFYEGYMSPGSDVRGAVVFEYQGERASQEVLINAEETTPEFYIGDIGVALGNSSLGDNPLGDRTSDVEADQDLLPKFRCTRDFESLNVHEYQPWVYSSELDARWEILTIGGNEIISEEEPTYLRV